MQESVFIWQIPWYYTSRRSDQDAGERQFFKYIRQKSFIQADGEMWIERNGLSVSVPLQASNSNCCNPLSDKGPPWGNLGPCEW